MAWVFFLELSGQGGSQAFFYLTLTAALIGFTLILVHQKQRELTTVISWFVLVVIILILPTGSGLLFYKLPVIENMGKLEDDPNQTSSVYAFMPQLLAIHIPSILHLAIDDILFDEAGERRNFIGNLFDVQELANAEEVAFTNTGKIGNLHRIYSNMQCGPAERLQVPVSQLKDSEQEILKKRYFTLGRVMASVWQFYETGKLRDETTMNQLEKMTDFSGSIDDSKPTPPVAALYPTLEAFKTDLPSAPDTAYSLGMRNLIEEMGGYVATGTGSILYDFVYRLDPTYYFVPKQKPLTAMGFYIYDSTSLSRLNPDAANTTLGSKFQLRRDLEVTSRDVVEAKEVLSKYFKNPNIRDIPVRISLGEKPLLKSGETEEYSFSNCAMLHSHIYNVSAVDVLTNMGYPEATARDIVLSGKPLPVPITETQKSANTLYTNIRAKHEGKSSKPDETARNEFLATLMRSAAMRNGLETGVWMSSKSASDVANRVALGSSDNLGSRYDPRSIFYAPGQFWGDILEWFANWATQVSSVFVGGIAIAYLKFLSSMLDMALMGMLMFTPLLFIFGIILPSNAMGVLIQSVMIVFIIKFVPVAFSLISFLLSILAEVVGNVGGGFEVALVVYAAAGLYTGIVGLTMFLLFKIGDYQSNIQSLTQLDSQAKQAAEETQSAARKTAAVAGLAAGAPLLAATKGGISTYIKGGTAGEVASAALKQGNEPLKKGLSQVPFLGSFLDESTNAWGEAQRDLAAKRLAEGGDPDEIAELVRGAAEPWLGVDKTAARARSLQDIHDRAEKQDKLKEVERNLGTSDSIRESIRQRILAGAPEELKRHFDQTDKNNLPKEPGAPEGKSLGFYQKKGKNITIEDELGNEISIGQGPVLQTLLDEVDSAYRRGDMKKYREAKEKVMEFAKEFGAFVNIDSGVNGDSRNLVTRIRADQEVEIGGRTIKLSDKYDEFLTGYVDANGNKVPGFAKKEVHSDGVYYVFDQAGIVPPNPSGNTPGPGSPTGPTFNPKPWIPNPQQPQQQQPAPQQQPVQQGSNQGQRSSRRVVSRSSAGADQSGTGGAGGNLTATEIQRAVEQGMVSAQRQARESDDMARMQRSIDTMRDSMVKASRELSLAAKAIRDNNSDTSTSMRAKTSQSVADAAEGLTTYDDVKNK